VLVTILLLSLVTGLRQMLVSAGSPNKFIAMRKGAMSDVVSFVSRDAVQALRHLPGVAQTSEGEPLMSPEFISQPLLPTKQGGKEMVLVRGITPMGFRAHDRIHFVAGRAPHPAVREAAVGIAASQRFGRWRSVDRYWTGQPG
jgi:hypothetical protein